MIPIELTHYAAWAERLEAALALAYPRTLWLVLRQDERISMTLHPDFPRDFQVVAVPPGTRRHASVDIPFAVVVDEEAFALVVVTLGAELERRLAAMVEEG